jgi:CHAT domain-containing protein
VLGTVAVLADPVFEEDDPRLRQAAEAAGATLLQTGAASPAEEDADASLVTTGRSFPRLLASRDEARAIVAAAPPGTALQALGFTANRATALSPQLGRYRIVHFATHGVIDSRHPELTYLVLSLVDERGQKQDGLLLLGDIYNLNLPVEMVVLSACNTGLGRDVRGEGLVGLTRGFMYAGASSVVASLWTIDDEATAELMRLFYSRMLVDGLPRAAALREAQLGMWKQKRWRAPYYWAAFVLQGDYRPPAVEVARVGSSYVFAWAAGGALLLLGGLYAVKRRRGRGATPQA